MPTVQDSNLWFKPVKEWPIPESTMRESFKAGARLSEKLRVIGRKQMNFQSYPMNERSKHRFSVLLFDPPEPIDMRTSYMRDFVEPYAPLCPPKILEVEPDRLMNRRPINSFLLSPYCSHKFMDDNIFGVTEERKKVDFFRQIRNQSNVF